MRWHSKPAAESTPSSSVNAPPSTGVTLSQRIRAWARATGSDAVVMPIAALLPVDPARSGWGPRVPRINPLSTTAATMAARKTQNAMAPMPPASGSIAMPKCGATYMNAPKAANA